MKESLSQDILTIFQRFDQHDFSIFLVGGCVRDFLMSRPIHDYDFATAASPKQVATILTDLGTIIPTGIQHGTITFRYHEESYEITTFRTEETYTNHRSPDAVTFVSSIKEDLIRRDFTMNAIAYHPTIGYIDPFHGREDIANGCIRCVNDPNLRFQEDALRILRALRFHMQLKFQIEANTYEAIKQHAHLLSQIAKERIQTEFDAMLMSDTDHFLQTLKDANVLYEICPKLILLEETQETPWHLHTVFTHTDLALNATKGYTLSQKLAIVFHDIGKKDCKYFSEDGVAHFKGHAMHSVVLTKEILQEMKYPKRIIQKVLCFIEYHDYRFPPKEKNVRRFLGKLNQDITLANQIIEIMYADDSSKNLDHVQPHILALQETRIIIHRLSKENLIQRKDLAIKGNDVIPFGFHGPKIQEILDRLYAHVVEHPANNTKEQLIKLLKQWQ